MVTIGIYTDMIVDFSLFLYNLLFQIDFLFAALKILGFFIFHCIVNIDKVIIHNIAYIINCTNLYDRTCLNSYVRCKHKTYLHWDRKTTNEMSQLAEENLNMIQRCGNTWESADSVAFTRDCLNCGRLLLYFVRAGPGRQVSTGQPAVACLYSKYWHHLAGQIAAYTWVL